MSEELNEKKMQLKKLQTKVKKWYTAEDVESIEKLKIDISALEAKQKEKEGEVD